ncbi:MAG: hypothetical protein HC905_06940 [Bacteroidales bacterium]|nr:hypothetical protein [Bacteroidales bacterium]
MKIFIRTILISLLTLLFAQQVQAQEFLVREETFTWEEAEDAYFGGNGFHWWNGDDYSSYPANWVSPHNYFEGRFYYRYEVISQPTNKPFDLMFLIWQFKEDGKHRETGDDRVPLSGGPGSVTEYNNAPPPSRWWTYHENADQLVDFTTIKQYNGGDNRMGLALWSDGNCIPSTWGGTNPDFCQDRRSDYFPMRIRITIVAVAEGHTFSGWSNYGSGGGGGGGGNPDVTFSIDYQNERTSQNVPNYYQYSFNQNRLDYWIKCQKWI